MKLNISVNISILYNELKTLMKKSKISILVSNSAHKALLIILITFFDLTEIRKVTVSSKLKKVNI